VLFAVPTIEVHGLMLLRFSMYIYIYVAMLFCALYFISGETYLFSSFLLLLLHYMSSAFSFSYYFPFFLITGNVAMECLKKKYTSSLM